MNLFYSSNNISILILQTIAGIPDRECSMKNRRRSFPQVFPNWLCLLTDSSFLYFFNSLLMSLSPLQSVHQMELSWASKRKWSSLLRRWSDCIKRIQNSIQHLSYLVLKSDIGENILIPVFRWARTHQETRQRSQRLKGRSTVSSELKLFWQWPLVKVKWLILIQVEGVGCREGFMWCYLQRLTETEEFRALNPWSGLEKWH